MFTANIICISTHNGIQSSQNSICYEMKENDTVADLVQYYRSTNEWPTNASITVLQKRSVDNEVSYSRVDDSYLIAANDTYEITVTMEAYQDSSSIDDDDVSTSSPSSSNTNDKTGNTRLKENDRILRNVYESHKSDVETFFQSLNKTTTFKKTNLHRFFGQPNDRLMLYTLSSTILPNEFSLLNICRDRFRGYLRKIIDLEFSSFDAKYNDILVLYMTITDWIDSETLATTRDEMIKVPWRSYIIARYRCRKSNAANSAGDQPLKKRKRRTLANVNDQTFDIADEELNQVARSMRENKTHDEIAEMFKQSIETRYTWYQYLIANFEQGYAEKVFDRFPRLLDNVKYLHDDYVYYMNKQRFPVCDVAQQFKDLIPGIFGLALKSNLIIDEPNVNRELHAAEVLALLVKQYFKGPAKRCTKERFIIGSTESINMLEIIRKKDHLKIIAPMIAYVKHRDNIEFYIIVDQKALKVNGTFADALQSMHELQFLLHLKYDECVAPLFLFLEYVLGFKDRECNARYRLKTDIQSFIPNVS